MYPFCAGKHPLRLVKNGDESQLQLEAECFADNAVNGEFAEGVAAFAEKRKPRFKGK